MTTAAIPSTDMGRDAVALHDHGDTHVSPAEIAIGVIIGRTSEFFDFFVYAIASVIVFPALFFPTHDPVSATMLSFALFPLAFIARPIGTQLFMAIDRAYVDAHLGELVQDPDLSRYIL